MEEYSPFENDELSEYDVYSKTPPRMKILRKNRERRQREKSIGQASTSPKVVKAKNPLGRRNTIGTMYDELIAKADTYELDHGAKRSNKRHMKLLRGSERDLKLDITSAQNMAHGVGKLNSEVKHPSFQIESCKLFKSLSCRTVQCLRPFVKKIPFSPEVRERSECPQTRVEFHNTLSMLIRMGGGDSKQTDRNTRRNLSRDETLWQNDLKDIIWLELQAFHADRTPSEEDFFLCQARESVEPLLEQIMDYQFQRQNRCFSTQNSDSGVEDDCLGCLAISCIACMEAQNDALREIEGIMLRLDMVEALFPSSKAFAEIYPLYNSPEFVGRVKAISLWYNMTRHQRLKLSILGKLLSTLQNKQEYSTFFGELVGDSPSDSNNSTTSSFYECVTEPKNVDLYNIQPIISFINYKDENNVSAYRKYIENILKTRALHNSLSFLDRLHQYVLRKAQLTLEKPACDDIFDKISCDTDEEELRRYGCWSPEAKAINLPSYRSTFIFLASIPLEIIHEYLLMRVEQKPGNPSPLSIRQLMRELKEGLKIATTERQRLLCYMEAVKSGTTEKTDCLLTKLTDFDNCMLRVFQDYLEYLEQWALLHHDTFQKNLLEEEFQFSCKMIEKMPNGAAEILGSKFLSIVESMIKRIEERLMSHIDHMLEQISKDEDTVGKQDMFAICRQFQSYFNEEREMSLKTMAFCKTMIKSEHIPEHCKTLRGAFVSFKCLIPEAISRIQNIFDRIHYGTMDEADKVALNARIREILMQVYRFGFDFHKELSESIPSEKRARLVTGMVHFANLWMQFVTERCERGRGMRPRWAYQGLEFLLTVCEPCNTAFLSEKEFDKLKKNMDVCISHVIGEMGPTTPDSGFFSASPRTSLDHIRSRSRGSSPSPRPSYKSQRSNASANSNNSRKTSMEQNSPTPDATDSTINFNGGSKRDEKTVRIILPPTTHADQVKEAIETLESELDARLRKMELIGKVLENKESKPHIRRRNVTFSWQRGIKIGQGRFGKVYTAVNNSTGEMMAVKEIPLQHNDNATIKRVMEEMKILEGIVHQNVVRYYGVEVHKEEMLFFMEFCAEGTLENLVAATETGLPELLVRRYTFQLVSGVAVLHEHGIVHRDIKTANIFLTDEGNCLKIGDFGCAAKIKSTTTMPGELKGFVGTQAYMAPEVFTKNMAEGHGRAADIWSVGCVVVEMASGKRPWAQFDSNYQIMFKVGMGQSPDPPDDMIDEGLDFLDLCFKHNPRERATANELLSHNFVKVGDDDL